MYDHINNSQAHQYVPCALHARRDTQMIRKTSRTALTHASRAQRGSVYEMMHEAPQLLACLGKLGTPLAPPELARSSSCTKSSSMALAVSKASRTPARSASLSFSSWIFSGVLGLLVVKERKEKKEKRN